MSDSLRAVEAAAEGLGDKPPIFKAQGSHSKVYFGDKYVYKLTEKKVLEKSTKINEILTALDDPDVKSHIPQTVFIQDLGGESLVVEELKRGDHPEAITPDLLSEVLDLLDEVHHIEVKQVITDFEGGEIPASEYWTNQAALGRQYADKILSTGTVEGADITLIESCIDALGTVCEKELSAPRLVLIYKDVYPPNILVDERGKLSAVVDWDSAMSGPVELEYAVLMARFPEIVAPIVSEADLDKDTLVCAGIVQCLRFWKSFTKDARYVEEQRSALKKLLEMKRS